ncbi:MAG: DUF4418 family protein [Methanomassiliicoccales archaeon]|jgi:hypothetical protein
MTEDRKIVGIRGKIIGVVLIILGILIAVGPWTIFPVCNNGDSTMACHYTAEAEIIVGSLVALLGLVLIIVNSAEAKIVVGIIGIASGIWTILVPTVLIGVCASDMMNCVKESKPALIALGAVTILVSLVLIMLVRKKDGA